MFLPYPLTIYCCVLSNHAPTKYFCVCFPCSYQVLLCFFTMLSLSPLCRSVRADQMQIKGSPASGSKSLTLYAPFTSYDCSLCRSVRAFYTQITGPPVSGSRSLTLCPSFTECDCSLCRSVRAGLTRFLGLPVPGNRRLTLYLPLVPAVGLTRVLFWLQRKPAPNPYFDVLYLDQDLRIHKVRCHTQALFPFYRIPLPQSSFDVCHFVEDLRIHKDCCTERSTFSRKHLESLPLITFFVFSVISGTADSQNVLYYGAIVQI